jgi:catechol 2,3-dioxygenase
MTMASVRALRSIEIGVTDVDASLRFFTEVWNLVAVGDERGVHYLRGTGPFHNILSIRRTPKTGLIRMVFDADHRATVDALHAQVVKAGLGPLDPPASLRQPNGSYGFGYKDPEGRNIAVVCGVKDHHDDADKPDRPRRLSHVNLNCGDNDATFAAFQALGFKLTDHTVKLRFLRCNSDHHCVVIGFDTAATLNHIAFELPDLDSVFRGAGRMIDNGHAIEWGPGRHGPGANVFCYFVGPEEIPIEYTGEMLQVDDHYPVGTPEQWQWPPRRSDRWGICGPPSERVVHAGENYLFTADGYRLDDWR